MLAVVQRRLMHYRVAPLRLLSERLGVDVHVFCGGLGPGLSRADLQGGIGVTCLPGRDVVIRWGAKRYVMPVLPGLGKALTAAHPAVVLAEGPTNLLGNLRLYSWAGRSGTPVIWWDAGRRRGARRNALRRLADPLIRRLIRRSAASVAYGSLAREYLIRMGASPDSIFVAQNTVILPNDGADPEDGRRVSDLRRDLAPGEETLVLYVGTLERRKRLDLLLRACQRVLDEGIPLRICIVGGGPAKGELQRLADDVMPGRCRFAGEVYNGVGAYFGAADMFVLPAEGGLAINHAMLAGLPVIAGSADGTEIDLIRPGENGFLVSDGDLGSLAGFIARLATDRRLRAAMSEVNRREAAERCSPERMVRGLADAARYALSGGINASGRHVDVVEN